MQIPRLPSAEDANPHDVGDFIADFHNAEVRAWVNWNRLAALSLKVGQELLTEKPAIGAIRSAWYRSPDGYPGAWRTRGHRNALIREVQELPDFPSTSSVKEIGQFTQMLHNTPEGTVITVPGIRTAAGELILLDGNHRVSAVYQSPRHYPIRVVYITGDDTIEVAPDFIHTQYANSSDAAWQIALAYIEAAYGRKPLSSLKA